uniref:DUF4174 domain-containing protein n=1 Tax=Petromyzon marinus TaxID=7757 RepID=S4RRK9_PETMA
LSAPVSTAAAGYLAQLAGRERLLVLVAPDPRDRSFQAMMSLLSRDAYCELSERQVRLLLVVVAPAPGGVAGGALNATLRRVSHTGRPLDEPLPASAPVRAALAAMRLDPRRFGMALLRKTLQVERRLVTPVRFQSLLRAIDVMPARRRERLGRRGWAQRCRETADATAARAAPAASAGATPGAARSPHRVPPPPPARMNVPQVPPTLAPVAPPASRVPPAFRTPVAPPASRAPAAPPPSRAPVAPPDFRAPVAHPPSRAPVDAQRGCGRGNPAIRFGKTRGSAPSKQCHQHRGRPHLLSHIFRVTLLQKAVVGVPPSYTLMVQLATISGQDRTLHMHRGSGSRHVNLSKSQTFVSMPRPHCYSTWLLVTSSQVEVHWFSVGTKPLKARCELHPRLTSGRASQELKCQNSNFNSAVHAPSVIKTSTALCKIIIKVYRLIKGISTIPCLFEKESTLNLTVCTEQQPNILKFRFDLRAQKLVLGAPAEEDAAYRAQKFVVKGRECELALRKVSVLALLGNASVSTLRIDHHHTGHAEQVALNVRNELITFEMLGALRHEFGLPHATYRLVLTDYDMRATARFENPVPLDTLLRVLDQMPSRLHELALETGARARCGSSRGAAGNALVHLLSRFHSKKRLFVISSPGKREHSYVQQLHALRGQACSLGLRHVVVIQLLGLDQDVHGQLEIYSANGKPHAVEREMLDSVMARNLRAHFGLREDYFSMVLVSKEGEVTSWFPSAMWSMAIVYDLIDSSPSRQHEMALQQSSGLRCPERVSAG